MSSDSASIRKSADSIRAAYVERYGRLLLGLSHANFTRWHYNVQAGHISFINCDFCGLSIAEESFPRALESLRDLIHPDDLTDLREASLCTLESRECGDQFERFFRGRSVSGEYIWLAVQGVVMGRDVDGSALHVMGLLIPQSRLEEELNKIVLEKERYRFALEATRDGLWDWDTHTNLIYFDPQYIFMLGYIPEEFPPALESWTKRVHKDDLDATLYRQLAHMDSAELGDTFDSTFRMQAADGSYRWILSRGKVVSRDENGHAKRVIGTHTDITNIRAAQDSLMQLVNHDSLTKLYSRWYFEKACSEVAENSHPVAIMYIDVDGLKLANDLMGHNAGDSLLIKTAELLRTTLRGTDVIARIGGDEFAVLMPRCSGASAEVIAEKIQAGTRKANESADSLPLFLSIGTASTDSGIGFDMLLSTADCIMLANKAKDNTANHAAMRAWLEKHTERRCSVCV